MNFVQIMRLRALVNKQAERKGHKPYLKLAWGRMCQPAWVCNKCWKRIDDIAAVRCYGEKNES